MIVAKKERVGIDPQNVTGPAEYRAASQKPGYQIPHTLAASHPNDFIAMAHRFVG